MRTDRSTASATEARGGRPRRRSSGALALAALALAAGACGAVQIETSAEPTGTRYGTAAVVAEEAADGGATTAIVTTGDAYADALAAAPLAAELDAPILLTGPDELPEETADALDDLEVDEVVVLGGEAAVGPEVEEALAEDFDVERRAGENRFATAAMLAGDAFPDGADTAVIVTGTTFADAPAAAPLAAQNDAPILLATADSVPPETASALEALGVSQVLLLGGEGALGPAVEAQLGERHDVRRIAWTDRYGTAAVAAIEAFPDGAETAVLVTGTGFADALAAAPLAEQRGAPILLTDPDALPEPTSEALGQLGVEEVVVVGGEGAVGLPVTNALAAEGYRFERLVG
ncbi:MAG: cell wall-binding repeat-containing protein [Acidimicrobiia bacterium]